MVMLAKQILDTKTKNCNTKDNNALNPDLKHRWIRNWTPLDEKNFFPKHQFKSSRVLSKSIPRRNKNLFQYKTYRSLNFNMINPEKNDQLNSSNSSLNNGSFDADMSLRGLSRSAKIMRALSFHQRNISIRKSLNFDSTPSSTENSSFDGSSHTNSTSVDISSLSSNMSDAFLKLDSSSADSDTSNILITPSKCTDENQNQTPQHNRKILNISSSESSDTKRRASKSESSPSTSLLRSELKKRIDNIIHMAEMPDDLQSPKWDNKSKALGYITFASTPRNLLQEFNQDEYDRPHTPENMIHLIPESMSAIKRSHKKEKLFRHGETSFPPHTDVSVKNEYLRTKETMESLEVDDMFTSATCSTPSIKESQKKNKIAKRIVYNLDNEIHDTKPVFNHDAQWKVTPREHDLSENSLNETENDKIQDIDVNDFEKSMQDNNSTHSINHSGNKEDPFDENVCYKEEYRQPLQEESSSICRVNGTNENRVVSPESNPTISQDFNRAATPENCINILEHFFTESIKKSHKKVKHNKRKVLFKTEALHEKMEAVKSEMSVQDINDDQCENITQNKTADATCVSNLQIPNRSGTPENANSSRLLLSQFNSVKRSHKKDKRGKRISGLAKCHKYHEYRKKSDSLLQNNRYGEKNTSKILHRNKLLESKKFPDVSPNKRKRSMNVSLQSNTCEIYSFESSSSEYENIDEEFKIYTPKRRTSSIMLATNCADKKSPKKDESAQETSKEVDYSRCMTPVMCCYEKSTENENLTSEKDENGRSTPVNMSTTELLCNIDSIKKSHKKDKHSRSIRKRQILEKNQSYTERMKNVNFTNSIKMLEEHTRASPLKHMNVDNHCNETGMCSNTCNEEVDKNYKKTVYIDSQPSTSLAKDNIENTWNEKESEFLNTTPPNGLNTAYFIELLHTTSIKKSHKKERDHNAQAKYIFMSKEHDLSDNGSIFDEEDKLNCAESYSPCQGSDNEMIK